MANFVHVSNLPADVDRQFVTKNFSTFGTIKKIYISPDQLWCKVYFAESQAVEAAVTSLNGKLPHRLNVTVQAETYKPNPKRQDNASTTSNHSSSMTDFDYDDFYADAGPDYYNIHGICIPTLTADDGKLYVPLDEVKSIGFELFEHNRIPRNLNLNQQTLTEFKVYLSIKARKYINKMNCQISEGVVEETKNEIISQYVSNGPAQRNNARQSYSSPTQTAVRWNASSQPNGSFDNRGSMGRDKPVQHESQKPLRKPIATNDNRSQYSNTQGAKNGATKKQWQSKNQNDSSSNLKKQENFSSKVQEKPLQKKSVCEKSMHEKTAQEEFLQKKPDLIQPNINRIQLPLNVPVAVTVSYVESQSKCWVFMKNKQTKLEELLFETNLQAINQADTTPVVGQVCASTYYGAWYRALVLEDTPAVKVQYLDFGNFNDEQVKAVRQLSAELIAEPVLAVCVNFTKPPKTTLADNVDLNIMPTKKNDDESYQVEEVDEKRQSPEMSLLNVVPAGKMVGKTAASDQSSKSGSQTRSSSSRSLNSSNALINTDKLSESISKVSLKYKQKSLNPIRKSVVDLFNKDEGIIEYAEKLDDNSCICFILPQNFLDELTSLEEITANTDSTMKLTAKIGDSVSVYKEDSETWVRGTVLNVTNNKYTVALVDYGTIVTTDKLSQLQKKYLNIPEFTCICQGKPECIQLIQNAKGEVPFESTVNNKIKVGFNDVFYDITCSRWDPFERQSNGATQGTSAIFTAAPGLKDLKDKERVMPIILKDGKLLVRNKETYTLFTKIKDAVSKYNASPLTEKPVVDQLVLVPHDSITGLCRGIIKSVASNNYADVEFVDYGFVDTVPVKNMKNIDEALAKEDSSLIPVVLKGFEDGTYSDDAIELIGTYCEQSRKLQSKKYSNNVFDLIINETPGDDTSLSEKLLSLTASNNRFMYKDMKKKELKLGSVASLLCVCFEDDGSIIFIPDDDVKDELCALNEEICEYTKKNKDPYSPIVGEVCLANYEGEWCRAHVIELNNALEEFQVYYMDYGNTAKITSSDIRKMPKEFATVPALALACCLTEIVRNKDSITPDIMDLLKDKVTMGASYDVKVLNKLDGLYEIEISALSPDLLRILEF